MVQVPVTGAEMFILYDWQPPAKTDMQLMLNVQAACDLYMRPIPLAENGRRVTFCSLSVYPAIAGTFRDDVVPVKPWA